jgi:hypothetical protein
LIYFHLNKNRRRENNTASRYQSCISGDSYGLNYNIPKNTKDF